MGAGRWNSWEEASRRPWQALGGAFAVTAVATGLISYYDGWTPRSAWDSAVIGVGCGVIVSLVIWRGIRAARRRASRR